jgi:hypothetical protein
MKNQHEKITGYRDLSKPEIDAMNEVKAVGEDIKALLKRIRNLNGLPLAPDDGSEECITIDQKWIDAGELDLQKGLMCVIRSVARPTTF